MTTWRTAYEQIEEQVLGFVQARRGSFEELALEVFRFQRRWNEPFRRYCNYRGAGEVLACWEEIPAVPQQAFKMSRLAVFPEAETLREFRTSGTTGEGYGSHFFASLRLYEAVIEAGWRAADLPRFPALVLGMTPEAAPHSSLTQMLAWLAGSDERRFFLRDGELEIRRLREEMAGQTGPVLVLGTALAFLNLLERETVPLPLPTGSVLMETGGYKGSGRVLSKAALYARLADFFSLPMVSLVNEYGMTELSSQFYTRGLDEPHRGGAWVRHRVIDPATGRRVGKGGRGVLQLFDLANVGSVLAVQTEDLAVETGDGFVLLGRDPAAVARGCSRSVDEMLNP